MQKYLDLLDKIINEGVDRSDRTGTGRRSLFGEQLRWNMADGLPLITTRDLDPSKAIAELLWFIKGSSDISELKELNCNIWNKWAIQQKHIDAFEDKYFKEETDKQVFNSHAKFLINSIGPLYGHSWRNAPQQNFDTLWPVIDFNDIPEDKLRIFKEHYQLEKEQNPDMMEKVSFEDYAKVSYRFTVDQLNELVINLRDRPYSTRNIVSAWIPEYLPFEELSPHENILVGRASLAPCHTLFQCFVYPPKEVGGKSRLSLQLYQRSNDIAVGAPFNILQYSVLLHMLAHVSNMEPYEFIWTLGDVHLYSDQIELAKEQLKRKPFELPRLNLNTDTKSIYDFKLEDFVISDYVSHPKINYPVSV